MFEVRKHWFILATETFWGLAASLAPAVLYAVVSVLPISLNTPGNPIVLFLFFYALWLLGVTTVMTYFWTDYFLDVWIVTNRRIIDVEQKGLFNREIATMQLSKMQDVTTEVNGLLATMVGFGNVHVQTAGNEREFTIYGVKDPDKTREMLEEALLQYGAVSIK